jgi:hypothetical protein
MTTLKTFEEFTTQLEEAKEKEYVFKPSKESKTGQGHTCVGSTWTKEGGLKGANICKHKETGKFFASGGSSTAVTKSTTFHDTPESAATEYHKKAKETLTK